MTSSAPSDRACSTFLVLHDAVACFFFSSRRRHTRFDCDWSSDVCSSDLQGTAQSGAINTIPVPPTPLRTSETTFLVNDTTIDANTRDAYRARNFLRLPTSTRVRNAAGTVVAQAEAKYDESSRSEEHTSELQ